MSGGIYIIKEGDPEQVLVGEHNGVRMIVLSVKPNEESAQACWEAACGILDTGVFDDSSALIIDIFKASVRHGYITEMPRPKFPLTATNDAEIVREALLGDAAGIDNYGVSNGRDALAALDRILEQRQWYEEALEYYARIRGHPISGSIGWDSGEIALAALSRQR